MNIVLLSGGSGVRLWPLSNDVRSKQFLKLLSDENGNKQSMVQRVYSQIRQSGYTESVTISTGITQVESIQSQLDENINIVIEPERRNTFPAIALATASLFFNQKKDINDTVVVLPIDPYAELQYFKNLPSLAEVVSGGKYKLGLMGIKPTYPSEKYGYMIPSAETVQFSEKTITKFKEKPTVAEAQVLINSGALWNAGVFAFKIGYILDILKKQIDFSSYDDVYNQYGKLNKKSFDYEVVELESSIGAISYDGYWKDLGTWNTLTEEIVDEIIGNVITDETVERSHILNELEIPLVVMGAKNMIIAASYDGILVADKHQSSYMKPLVEKIGIRPMYEEKSWGSYKVLDFFSDNNGNRRQVKQIKMLEGKSRESNTLEGRKKVITVYNGSCNIAIGDKKTILGPCDCIEIEPGCHFVVTANSNLEIVEISIG